MRTPNLNQLISLSILLSEKDAVASAINAAIEVGVVVPSILRAKLEALGLTFSKNPRREFENVVQIDVLRAGAVIASGTSSDEADALLHAMLGYVRETAIADLMNSGATLAEARARIVPGALVL